MSKAQTLQVSFSLQNECEGELGRIRSKALNPHGTFGSSPDIFKVLMRGPHVRQVKSASVGLNQHQ